MPREMVESFLKYLLAALWTNIDIIVFVFFRFSLLLPDPSPSPQHVGAWYPWPGIRDGTCTPLQWKLRNVTSGPPGNPSLVFLKILSLHFLFPSFRLDPLSEDFLGKLTGNGTCPALKYSDRMWKTRAKLSWMLCWHVNIAWAYSSTIAKFWKPESEGRFISKFSDDFDMVLSFILFSRRMLFSVISEKSFLLVLWYPIQCVYFLQL